jgi:inhibitor of KinA sporulation pathway (predicted exonuclease)
MNYIIFDLELNSKPFKNRHPNEIIEIGAVKLNSNFEVVGTFQSFVRPKIYKKLFKVIKQKTDIKQEDINGAEDFKTVLTRFKEWADKDYILCSWGYDDIHHLRSNCKLYRLSAKWIKRYFDIQKQFSVQNGLPSGQVSSLGNALEVLGVNVDEKLHRADIDAKYTAGIFVRLVNDSGSIFDVNNI